MFHVAQFLFHLRQVASRYRARTLIQQLLRAAQVIPEPRQRFRERVVRYRAYAVLLDRKRRIQQRSPAGHAVHRFFRALNVRRHDAAHPLFKFCRGALALLVKRRLNPRGDVVEYRFRPPVHFISMQTQHVIQLLVKSNQRLLVQHSQPGGEMFQRGGGFSRPGQRELQTLGSFLHRFTQREQSPLQLSGGLLGIFLKPRAVTGAFIL